MKKWWFGEKKHLDQEKIEQEKEDCRNLRWLMDYGTVEQYVAYVRGIKPSVTDEELSELTAAFFAQRAERRRERGE
jgi:DNA replicative helicase MCM subunit Mcm2 (Cdc46/Mcm family)